MLGMVNAGLYRLASSHGHRHQGLGEAVASVWLHTIQVLETVIVFRRCHVPEAQHRWGRGAVRWVRKRVIDIELTILVIGLRQQMQGYWSGLSAFYTTSVLVSLARSATLRSPGISCVAEPLSA